MSGLRIIDRPSPYSSLLENLGSFSVTDALKTELKSFLRGVKCEVDECQRTIDDLKTALRAAEKDRAAAQAFYDAHDSLSPPIHDLPAELVIRILELCIGAEPLQLTGSQIREPRRSFSIVCQRWRRIVLSTPSFWSDIVTAKNSNGGVNMTILAAALKRSRNAPLSFNIHDNELQHVLKSLVPHSSRWRRVTISGNMDLDIPDLGTPAMLETLRLELDVFQSTQKKLEYRCIHFLELFKDAPRLRDFALPRHGGKWLCPNNIDFPWRQLTRLEIGGGGCEVYSLLNACPDLQHLDALFLHEYKDSTDIPRARQRICHENLMSLQVQHPNYLQDIECPNLDYLHIREEEDYDVDMYNSGTVECYRSFMSHSKYPSLRLEHRCGYMEDEEDVMNFMGMIADTRIVALTLDFRMYSGSWLEACTWLVTECMAFPLMRTLALIISEVLDDKWIGNFLQVVAGKVKGSSLERISLKVNQINVWGAEDYLPKWAREAPHAYPYLQVESVSKTFIDLVVKQGLINPGNVAEQVPLTSKDVIQSAAGVIGL